MCRWVWGSQGLAQIFCTILSPFDLGLNCANTSRRDALSWERPSSAWLLWELPG